MSATRARRSLALPTPCTRKGSPTILPADMRGSSEENGSWKMICIWRRKGRSSALPRCVMSVPLSLMDPAVASIRRRIARPTVDLPQPDSPTSASVSPGLIDRLTPSTAYTCPVVRRSRPFLIGKCFFRFVTSSTGGRGSGMAASIETFGMPAGGPACRSFLLVGRRLAAAAIVCKRAARRERAASREMSERGHDAGDFLQAPLGLTRAAAHQFEPRDRSHQPVRIGMQWTREQVTDARLFDLLAGIHHDHALRGLGDDAEIVRDE